MGLTESHYDLLRVVDLLETDNHAPSTQEVGAELLRVWKERGGSYSWHATPPWHGTSPYAEELRSWGLLDVHVGMADFRPAHEPTPRAQLYWLGLTEAGRARLAEPTP